MADDDAEYLYFSLTECSLAMTRSDSNNDEKLFFGEFLDAVIRLSPFPACPDIESASVSGSPYRIVFEELLCACIDYPSLDPPSGSFDPLCCDRSGSESIRLPFFIYPDTYTERLCLGMELALAADCIESTEVPSGPSEGETVPTVAPSNRPVSAPVPTRPPTLPTEAPIRSLIDKEEDEDDSILGLPKLWTILAWISFAACSLVLLALLFLFLTLFCCKRGDPSTKDDGNGNEEEHEITFEREGDISENENQFDSMEPQSSIFGVEEADTLVADESGDDEVDVNADDDDIIVEEEVEIEVDGEVDHVEDDIDGDDEYEEESLDDEEAITENPNRGEC